MANKIPKSGGSGGVLSILALIGTAASLATPVIDYVADKRKERIEEIKDWVKFPDLLSKGMPMKFEAAIDVLEKNGLKVSYSPVELNSADIKYKDCFDLQVVWADHKYSELVKPGDTVIIRYVTSEIITASQRLFDEAEKHKADKALKKAEKRSRQKEKNRQTVDSLISRVQQNTVGVFNKAKQLKATRRIKNPSEEEEV